LLNYLFFIFLTNSEELLFVNASTDIAGFATPRAKQALYDSWFEKGALMGWYTHAKLVE
jgi:hypothetical protein